MKNILVNKFLLGFIHATDGALDALSEMPDGVAQFDKMIDRHAAGDWGDLSDDDKAENEFSLNKYLRLLSAYNVNGVKFWVITEANRTLTTILLPSEY